MSITGFSSSAFLEALRNHQVISLNKDWVSGSGYVHVVKFTWGGGGGYDHVVKTSEFLCPDCKEHGGGGKSWLCPPMQK